MKKLVEQTKETIAKIDTIVESSNGNMKDVIQSVSEVKQMGETESEYTDKSFKEIIQAIEDNLKGASEINEKIESFVSVIDEIEHATESVARQDETLNETANGF